MASGYEWERVGSVTEIDGAGRNEVIRRNSRRRYTREDRVWVRMRVGAHG